jgi:hypothetical protein
METKMDTKEESRVENGKDLREPRAEMKEVAFVRTMAIHWSDVQKTIHMELKWLPMETLHVTQVLQSERSYAFRHAGCLCRITFLHNNLFWVEQGGLVNFLWTDPTQQLHCLQRLLETEQNEQEFRRVVEESFDNVASHMLLVLFYSHYKGLMYQKCFHFLN